jgi:hypothetical protein
LLISCNVFGQDGTSAPVRGFRNGIKHICGSLPNLTLFLVCASSFQKKDGTDIQDFDLLFEWGDGFVALLGVVYECGWVDGWELDLTLVGRDVEDWGWHFGMIEWEEEYGKVR